MGGGPAPSIWLSSCDSLYDSLVTAYLVEQLGDDGVQAAAAPGVVPGVPVQLEAALARPDKVEPCPAPATAAPWPEGGVVHPCEVEDEVLNK